MKKHSRKQIAARQETVMDETLQKLNEDTGFTTIHSPVAPLQRLVASPRRSSMRGKWRWAGPLAPLAHGRR